MDAYWGLGLDPEVAARLEHGHELLERGTRIAHERERRAEAEACTIESGGARSASGPAARPSHAAGDGRRARRWMLGRSGAWLATR